MINQSDQSVEVWGGMECTINRVADTYFDQLSYTGHRECDGDTQLFADLGFKKMRYPILWESHQPDKSQPIEWRNTAIKLEALRTQIIDVIAGLVHHGSGPAYVDIRDNSFVDGLAHYAGKVAAQFPWINYYTPVNEPLTTARFCGLYGLWYPHKKDDRSFCRILVNECMGTVMAMKAIRIVNPNAKLVQTDDLGKVHSTPALRYQADFENERRWLSYDLLCGCVDSNHALWNYLTQNGIRPEELNYFLSNPCPPDVLGINYYLTSERYLDEDVNGYPPHTYGGNGRHKYADVEAVRVGNVCPDGIQNILKSAWERYKIPIAVTEVHLHCTREEQMRWLKYVWDAAYGLKQSGVPVLAITPWALLGSVGWNHLLTQPGGTYESGVFDLSNGYRRPTILAAMIKAFSRQQPFYHHVLDTPGWWERECRVEYGQGALGVLPTGPPFIISGIYTKELRAICKLRGLNCDTASNGCTWATINANECLEIQRADKIELIICMTGQDIKQALNAGIDLFIDNESGYWAFAADGTLQKQTPYIRPVQHFLAS